MKKIENLRERVKYVREAKLRNGEEGHMSDEDIKKMISAEKRKLIQFRSADERGNGTTGLPEQKRRKVMNDHKSRCTDLKVHYFRNTKEVLDREASDGLITSWERVYKYIINKNVNSMTNAVEPVMREATK